MGQVQWKKLMCDCVITRWVTVHAQVAGWRAGAAAGSLSFSTAWPSGQSWPEAGIYCVLRTSFNLGAKSQNPLWIKLSEVSKLGFLMTLNSVDNGKRNKFGYSKNSIMPWVWEKNARIRNSDSLNKIKEKADHLKIVLVLSYKCECWNIWVFQVSSLQHVAGMQEGLGNGQTHLSWGCATTSSPAFLAFGLRVCALLLQGEKGPCPSTAWGWWSCWVPEHRCCLWGAVQKPQLLATCWYILGVLTTQMVSRSGRELCAHAGKWDVRAEKFIFFSKYHTNACIFPPVFLFPHWWALFSVNAVQATFLSQIGIATASEPKSKHQVKNMLKWFLNS